MLLYLMFVCFFIAFVLSIMMVLCHLGMDEVDKKSKKIIAICQLVSLTLFIIFFIIYGSRLDKIRKTSQVSTIQMEEIWKVDKNQFCIKEKETGKTYLIHANICKGDSDYIIKYEYPYLEDSLQDKYTLLEKYEYTIVLKDINNVKDIPNNIE